MGGRLAVTDGRPAEHPTSWADLGTPTLSLLQQLAAGGWSVGKAPAEHTMETPKLFTVRDPLEAKEYLRCLLGLPTLVQRGLHGARVWPAGELLQLCLGCQRPVADPCSCKRERLRQLARAPSVS